MDLGHKEVVVSVYKEARMVFADWEVDGGLDGTTRRQKYVVVERQLLNEQKR